MKINTFKRIIKEDFSKENQPIADKIGFSINVFAEDVSLAFNNNLSVDDNLNMQYKDLHLKLDSNNIPLITTEYTSTINGKVKGISVEFVSNLDNPGVYPSSAPFVTFSQNNKVIRINHITGLSPGFNYLIRILAKG